MTNELQLQLRSHCVRTNLLILVALVAMPGCTRALYRRQADREANYLVREKSVGTPWQIPATYTIQPDPRSRFFDPTNPNFPSLPPAGPHLYQYQLPDVGQSKGWQAEPLPPTLPEVPQSPPESNPAPELPSPPPAPEQGQLHVPGVRSAQYAPGPIALASYQQSTPAPKPKAKQRRDPFLDFVATLGIQKASVKELEPQPVGKKYWATIPQNCLARMLEFDSVRTEYEDTYGEPPGPELLNNAPRVGLHELFDLALIDSREYQQQKESLYEQALDVSLQRYAYATKFNVRGGTVDTTYTHLRSNGTTINSLSVPSSLQGNKLMATGGTLVGQFANDILLTFNGPSGFAADVSSELLLQITQSVFQRDIVLEPLIQSERNLVYGGSRFCPLPQRVFPASRERVLRDPATISKHRDSGPELLRSGAQPAAGPAGSRVGDFFGPQHHLPEPIRTVGVASPQRPD